MKYQGIIFDLDGVLCFTDRYHFLAWKALADRLGIYFDEQINHRQRGISRMESLEVLLEQSPMSYSAEEKLQLAEEKNETYKKLLEQMSPADVTEEVRYASGHRLLFEKHAADSAKNSFGGVFRRRERRK